MIEILNNFATFVYIIVGIFVFGIIGAVITAISGVSEQVKKEKMENEQHELDLQIKKEQLKQLKEGSK